MNVDPMSCACICVCVLVWIHIYKSVCVFICMYNFLCLSAVCASRVTRSKAAACEKPPSPAGTHFKVRHIHTHTPTERSKTLSLPPLLRRPPPPAVSLLSPSHSFVLPPPPRPPSQMMICQLHWLRERAAIRHSDMSSVSAVIF